jgi:hypothetical protein
MFEIGDAPYYLSDFIIVARERQNGVVVGLRHGIADAITLYVCPILAQDQPACLWVMGIHPITQGRADVEADLFKIAQLRVRQVTFSVNAFIPVFIWSCADLVWDYSGEWIFTWRLVKVAVDCECANCHRVKWFSASRSGQYPTGPFHNGAEAPGYRVKLIAMVFPASIH